MSIIPLYRTPNDLNVYNKMDNDESHMRAYDGHVQQAHTSNEQIVSDRKPPSTMLETMRKKRSTTNFNENYVADTQNNGKKKLLY